jgi:predicted transposase/invertase (TIGR01784 family)
MVTRKQIKKKGKKIPDYDSAWKDIIEEHFEPFLEFFFPHIHKDIDFTKSPEILSNELRRIVPSGKVGKRRADVLVKVFLKDGTQRCICVFIHVEVQGTRKPGFMERIFVYYYRIFEKYREQGAEIISLAILTDEDENYRPNEYYFQRWGFEHRMKIPLVKIIDYKNKKELREKLEISVNPMSLAVRVQLKSFEAKKGDDKKKYDIKRELIRQYYSHGYDGKYIRSLFYFIDLIFRLPESFDKKLSEEIIQLEEEYKMQHVTSWERIAKKEGKIEGMEKKAKETAKKMLEDGLPIETILKYTGLTEKEVKELMS